MSFELAKATITECRRILSDNGKFYLDLISGDDDKHYTEFSGDEIVTISHENTIQSFYNFARIQGIDRREFFPRGMSADPQPKCYRSRLALSLSYNFEGDLIIITSKGYNRI